MSLEQTVQIVCTHEKENKKVQKFEEELASRKEAMIRICKNPNYDLVTIQKLLQEIQEDCEQKTPIDNPVKKDFEHQNKILNPTPMNDRTATIVLQNAKSKVEVISNSAADLVARQRYLTDRLDIILDLTHVLSRIYNGSIELKQKQNGKDYPEYATVQNDPILEKISDFYSKRRLAYGAMSCFTTLGIGALVVNPIIGLVCAATTASLLKISKGYKNKLEDLKEREKQIIQGRDIQEQTMQYEGTLRHYLLEFIGKEDSFFQEKIRLSTYDLLETNINHAMQKLDIDSRRSKVGFERIKLTQMKLIESTDYTCLICGEGENGVKVVACPKCGAKHHCDCAKFNGNCSVYGCGGEL